MSAHPEIESEHEAIPRRALVAIGVVLVLWTTNILWVRQAGDDIAGFTAWRMILALPVLGVFVFATRGAAPAAPHHLRRPPSTAIRWAIVGVGALFAISAFVNFVSLNETTLVNVGVIHALQPAIVAVFAARFLGEILDRRMITRVAVAIAGTVLVAVGSSGEGSWSLTGDLLAVLGLLLNSVWFLAGRWIRTRTTIDASGYMMIVFATAAATMSTIAIVSGASLVVPASVLGFALLTAVGGTTGHTLMAWAHRYVPASISSLFLLSQPALVGILAWIAFGEALGAVQILGIAVVVGALTGVVTRLKAEPSPEAPGVLPDERDSDPALEGE